VLIDESIDSAQTTPFDYSNCWTYTRLIILHG